VFEFIAHSPFGFWIIAALVIVADAALLLSPGDFTFTFGARLNVVIRINESPFLLRHKEPIITLFAYPLTMFFISSIKVPSKGRAQTKRDLLRHKRVTQGSVSLVWIALFSLMLLSIVGPMISLRYGIERALLVTIPALYASAVCGAMIVFVKRSLFGFDNRALTYLTFELLVCPILLVNIFKRLAVKQVVVCNDDLINYFCTDPAETTKRLTQHVEAIE
jgi:hypothetical protein